MEGWEPESPALKRGKLRQWAEHQAYKKTLKQHQGAKEGPQKRWSGAETHLDTPSLRLVTSSLGAEVAACFAGRRCLLSSWNDGIHLLWLKMPIDTVELKHRGVIKEVFAQEHSENLKENGVTRILESRKSSGS